MPWKDKNIIEEIMKIRDQFSIKHFVETGTYEGVGARFWSKRFDFVHTCENNPRIFETAKHNCRNYRNIELNFTNSPDFLREIRNKLGDIPVFYFLDAHDHRNKYLPLQDEIKMLNNTLNCHIAIHDFYVPKENLGFNTHKHRKYELMYVKDLLNLVNSNFHMYYNTRENAKLWSVSEVVDSDIFFDSDTITASPHGWRDEEVDEKRKFRNLRGVLFCTPHPIINTTLVRVEERVDD